MLKPNSAMLLLFIFLIECLPVLGAFAQQDQAESVASIQAVGQEDDVTIEQIDRRLMELESGNADDAVKAQAKDLYQKARLELERAANMIKKKRGFQTIVASAANDLQQARADAAMSPAALDMSGFTDSTPVDDLVAKRKELEKSLQSARESLADIEAAPNRLAERRQKIPGERADAERDKSEIQQQLSMQLGETVPQQVAVASETLALARQQAVSARLAMLEQEQQANSSQGAEYFKLRAEYWNKKIAQENRDFERLVRLIEARRRNDARSQQQDASAVRQAIEQGNGTLVFPPEQRNELAQLVSQLEQTAEKRVELASEIARALAYEQEINSQIQRIKSDKEKIKDRLPEGNTAGIGIVLNRKLRELPNASVLGRNLFERREKMRSVQDRLFVNEDRRTELVREEVRPEWRMANLESEITGESDSQRMASAISVIRQCEAAQLNDIISDDEKYIELLSRVNVLESELLRKTTEYRIAIEKNVFWVRTCPGFSMADIQNLTPAIQWFYKRDSWSRIGAALVQDAVRNAILWAMAFLIWASIAVFRPRWNRRLAASGAIAERRTCREFTPTAHALLLTLLIALPLPLFLFFIGWRMKYSDSAFGHVLSDSFLSISYFFALFEFMRHCHRKRGLAECHFGYSTAHCQAMYYGLWRLACIFLPLVFLADIYDNQANPYHNFSAGRVLFFAAVVSLVFTLLPMVEPLEKEARLFFKLRTSPSDNSTRNLKTLVIVFGGILITLAFLGYFFAAWRLLQAFLEILLLLFGLLLVSALLNRWVRVERRAISYQQAMERRQRQLDTENDETTQTIDELFIDEDSVDVRQLDDQSRRLIRNVLLIGGFLGLLFSLRELVPAFAVFDRIHLWPKQTIDGVNITWVTLNDVMLSLLVFVTTYNLAKNLPGFVEMVFSQQLKVESSIRYAIGRLMAYVVTAVGLVIGFAIIGVTWSKVQWLVAAMGVGLGFGLQEIFANIVAGIMLLFERPIRVGDVVTIGETTGVVTRIQVRATTIRNWDRQDLIVPNRDLVTGQLVNWSLSGGLNRIAFDVGVAYGSDARRVRELLFEVLGNNPKVLDQPGPLITFNQFSDSALNFRINAYLASIDDRLETTNELHTAIHEAFSSNGIEIPFPQRDLHVRSIDQVVKTEPIQESYGLGNQEQ